MSRFDVTCLGEGGLRLSVPVGTSLATTDRLEVRVVGTEANVACALGNLGWQSAWVSALDSSPLGRRIAREIRSHGVDLSGVRWVTGSRTGVYFVEYASPPRPTEIHYDRANTAFTHLSAEQVDWDTVLNTRLIHLSGLTAALGDGPNALVNEAAERARAAGVPLSFDVNYRSNLQSPEQAANTLRPLIIGAEILFCREQDARTVFGLEGDRKKVATGLHLISAARHIVMSIGSDGVAHLHDHEYLEHPSLAREVADRLGAGDGLAAGVLHAWLDDDMASAARVGSVMAALALSRIGEQVIATREELVRLVQDATMRLRR